MEEYYVDTSALLRFFTNDEPKASEVSALLNNRNCVLRIPIVVVAETVYTLRSYYKIPKGEIINMMKEILSLPNVRAEKTLVSVALDLHGSSSLSFADALLVVLSKKHKTPIFSYDIALNKLAYKSNG